MTSLSSPSSGHDHAPTAPVTAMTSTIRLGAILGVALLAAIVVWMTTTMISGAVIAQGQAVVRGKPKVVQSLDGGIVAEILVENGDTVRAGDVLMRLDPTLLEINLDMYRSRLAEIIARQSRLEAEYVDADTIAFTPPPPQLQPAAMEQHVTGQREIFEARSEVLAGRKEQLRERILQFRNQITGVEGRIKATEDQLEFVATELTRVRELNRQGLARESQMLELQGNEAQLLGQLSEAQAELARIENSIRDTELEILQADRQFREEVVTELREVTAQREELTLQIVTIEKQLERIEVLAPADGIVHEMQVSTVGGVVTPEATILEVVPILEGVDFEVRVEPRSIDQVFVGQRAKLVFPAFNLRTVPDVVGSVATVSPSSITDEATGQTYYRVGLTVPDEQLALLGDAEIIPGMPIEAFLQTGERSVYDYLTRPLSDQIRRAFRDE